MALSVSFLATRWGTLLAGINESVSFGGGTATTRANSILAQYASLSAQADVVDDLSENALNVQQDMRDWATFLGGRCYAVLQAMARDDTARPTSNTVPDLFEKLSRDMLTGSPGEAFSRPAVTATVVAANALGGTNAGDGYLIASAVEPVDGAATYYAKSEVIRVLCTADSYAGEATAGSEPFLAAGETAVDALDFRWPKGSGAQLATAALDPDAAGILDGAKLDTADWTGTSLTDWVAVGGAFGAAANGIISKSTTSTYTPNVSTSAFALLTGDAALTLGIYQVLDQTKVQSNTNYGIQFWIKASSGAGAATLSVALRDSAAAIITDNAAASQEVTLNAAGINAANGVWTRVSGVLRTPKNLPSELRLDIRTATAALAAARTLGIDHVEFFRLDRAYAGGPYLGVGAGATAFAKNDGFTLTIANSLAGRTSYVRALDGVFGLAAQDIRLQTTTSPTILDSRIS